jgi:hypothetical protein
MPCTLNTIKELIQPWPRQQQGRQQLLLQLLEGARQQLLLQYLQVTLQPLREPRLPQQVAQHPQQQLQYQLMVVPQQQLHRQRLLRVLPLLLLPRLILEHLPQRPQLQQRQRLEDHLLQPSLQWRPRRQKVPRQPLQLQLQLQQLVKAEIKKIFAM